MAIIKCPECGKEVSNKALSCPHCGCPFVFLKNVTPKFYKRIKIKRNTIRLLKEWILGLFFFFIAVPCISLLLASSGISIYFMALFGVAVIVAFIKWENGFSKKAELQNNDEQK